jgi:hypothetical protein
MNHLLLAFSSALTTGALLWLAILWLCPRGWTGRHERWTKVLVALAVGLVLFLPFGGMPLWNRVLSFYPNPSLPTLGIVGVLLWRRLFGFEVFNRADWRATWAFGALVGSVLYLHPVLWGAIDLYYWGGGPEVAVWILAGPAIGLLAGGNRLGGLLVAALLAYSVQALESPNCWDYMMDPVYWALSLVAVGRLALGAATRWIAGFRAAPGN